MSGKKRAVILNYGCKLNQFEGESIAHSLTRYGFAVLKLRGAQHWDGDKPDVIVINTCTVTKRSDRKSRNAILRAATMVSRGGLLIVTGCYAQTNQGELKDLKGVSWVIGQEAKSRIPHMIDKHFNETGEAVPGRFKARSAESSARGDPFSYPVPDKPDRSRVFIKVQDGCNNHCAYCKVPLARGSSISRNYLDLEEAMNRLFRNGYHETVLTGVNLGSYRYGEMDLSGLLLYLLRNTPDGLRIRLSSIEPDCFNDELLRILGHDRIMPHFHIPIQSGSDRVLDLMGRSYTTDDIENLVTGLRAIKADCHFATDVMVGFPGEGEEDFHQTLELIRSVEFGSLHVFRYSVRDGTTASRMGDSVPLTTKSYRSNRMRDIGKKMNYSFRKRYEGTIRSAVLESRGRHSMGVTDNYIRVTLDPGAEDLSHECLPIKIHTVTEEYSLGCVFEV